MLDETRKDELITVLTNELKSIASKSQYFSARFGR
jgi:hypothetical protein